MPDAPANARTGETGAVRKLLVTLFVLIALLVAANRMPHEWETLDRDVGGGRGAEFGLHRAGRPGFGVDAQPEVRSDQPVSYTHLTLPTKA